MDTSFLDENIELCMHRGYFDSKEIEAIFDQLDDLGFINPDISVPIIDWTRERMYCASDKMMDALLDLRNSVNETPPVPAEGATPLTV